MTFALPWALWGLLAIPALIGIYFFRRRFRPRTVSALFLWQAPRVRTGGGRKISTFEFALPLVLEILIAALLTAAASGPGCRAQINIHQVAFVLDDSASMSAKSSDGKTARDRASNEIIKYLGKRKPFSCNIILSGFQPKLLAGTLTNIKDVDEALKQWRPEKATHGFLSAFRMARQISGDKGDIVFLSDHRPPKDKNGKHAPPEGARWLSAGMPLENVGIITASRKQKVIEGKEEIFLIARNFGKKERNIELTCAEGLDGKGILTERKIKLPGNSERKISLELTRIIKAPLKVSIVSEDALTGDNSVILAPDASPRTRVCAKFKGKNLKKLFDSTFAALGNAIILTKKRPHIIVSDAREFISGWGKKYPESWQALFCRQTPDREEARINFGPYVVSKNNLLCKGISLKGIRWASLKKEAAEDSHMPLVSCKGFALVSEKPSLLANGPRQFFFSFLPRFSNLQRTPVWPVMIHNLIKMRSDSFPGFRERNHRAGESAKGNFPNAKTLKLTPLSGGKAKIFKTDAVSFASHSPEVFALVVDGKKDGVLVFNLLSPEESDLRECASGLWEDKKQNKGIAKAAWRDESWLFLLAALALAFLHMFLVRRKEARL